LKSAISLVFFILVSFLSSAQSNHARRGIVDLRQYDFAQNGPIDLSGEWAFYMRQLIPPEKFNTAIDEPGDFVSFPMIWNDINKSRKPGEGYGTFYCKILIKPGLYAIEIPHFYSSYKLWINGVMISSNGVVSASAKNATPQWLPRTVNYTATAETLDIVIQVSNYFHAKGGVRENILIGNADDLNLKRSIAVNSNLVLFGGLSIIALMFLIIYAIVRKDSTSLFFALLCASWALRSIFSNMYVATSFFPDFPWETAVKIEYITLYLTMIWAICFISAIFPDDVNSMFKYLFIGCNGIFVVLTIFFNASLYTQFLPVYLSFSAVLLIFILYVLIHAFVYERQGVWMIVSCIMLGVGVYAYDISAYEGFATYSPIITNIGYLTMFILLAVCLAVQFGILSRSSRKSDMLTYEDLYGTNKK
jgi:hypothetical protein